MVQLLAKWLLTFFFSLSGYLIFSSLIRSQGGIFYFVSRIFRIYPALIFQTLILGILVAPFLSNLSFDVYITDLKVYKYLILNSTIIVELQDSLPGVFVNNPFPNSVNGVLWTVMVEIRAYLFIWIVYIFAKIVNANYKFVLLFAFLFFLFMYTNNASHIQYRLYSLFFLGSLFTQFNIKSIGFRYFSIFSFFLIVASFFLNTFFDVTFAFLQPFLIFRIAFSKIKTLSFFNKIGDPSYGIYLYHFVIQQILVFLFGINTPWVLILNSLLITLIIAYLSWFLLEKPILSKKKSFTIYLESKFDFFNYQNRSQ
jgi:peptidoglycan/LPS O-acetylase OafA/YrhL